MKIKAIKAHFLNDEQKKIKVEILEKLMIVMFDTLNNKGEEFFNDDAQLIIDCLISCFIMFGREFFITFFNNTGDTFVDKEIKVQLVEHILQVIKTETLHRLGALQ